MVTAIILTTRLELIAATVETARADLQDKDLFAELLNAQVPNNWPPEFNDDDSKRYILQCLTEHPGQVGWHGWYFVLNNETANAKRILIGIGGFKGIPDQNGVAEVGYSLLSEFQNKGYASEAVIELLDWAFEHPQVSKIIAETLPQLPASIQLLEKVGFVFFSRSRLRRRHYSL